MPLTFVRTLLLSLSVVLLSHDVAAQTTSHVRVADRYLRDLLASGTRRSPTLRSLIEQLDVAPVLVFVDTTARMPLRMGAYLQLMTHVGSVRYLLVVVDPALAPNRQVSMLAHELQHALEVGLREAIVDTEDMEEMFEEVGFQALRDGNHKTYDTAEAIAVQQRVYAELTARIPPNQTN